MKLDQTGLKKAIWCLKVPFFPSLPGVNGLRREINKGLELKMFRPTENPSLQLLQREG